MKLASIKWWWCLFAWFNYQYFVCCNGNTCQPCQSNSDTLPPALPLTSSSQYHHPESSVSPMDNDIWIGFLAGYGHAKVGVSLFFHFGYRKSVTIISIMNFVMSLVQLVILTFWVINRQISNGFCLFFRFSENCFFLDW